MPQYDYLIAGAGFFGCVFAQQAVARGKRCLVIDRRGHIGGNAHCEEIEGIQVHRYVRSEVHDKGADTCVFVR